MDGMSQILVWVVWVAWVLKILTRVKRNDRDQNFIVSETYDFTCDSSLFSVFSAYTVS